MFSSIDSTMVRAILPEISLVVLAMIVLAFDLVWRRATRVGLDESHQEELAVEGNSVCFGAAPKQIVTLRFEC